jgi:hypothetical protein
MMIRLMPSDPAYKEVNRVVNAIAIMTNAHLFWDTRTIPEAERQAALAELRECFEELAR